MKRASFSIAEDEANEEEGEEDNDLSKRYSNIDKTPHLIPKPKVHIVPESMFLSLKQARDNYLNVLEKYKDHIEKYKLYININ